MPGWQSFYEQNRRDDFEVVSVAIDVQGPAKARPWVEQAGATHPSLVDRDGVLPAYFHLNYVPFTVLIDETGRVARGPQMADVNNANQTERILAWVEKGPPALARPKEPPPSKMEGFASPEAELRYRLGALLQSRGESDDALVQFKRALDRDRGNWIIRKQIWAIEHPERFYEGPVDFAWQREKLAAERNEQGKRSEARSPRKR